MPQQPVVVAIIVGVVLTLWILSSIMNRPKTPDHDIRRRALQIIGGAQLLLLGTSTVASPAVIVIMLLTAATTMLGGLYLVLRSPTR